MHEMDNRQLVVLFADIRFALVPPLCLWTLWTRTHIHTQHGC